MVDYNYYLHFKEVPPQAVIDSILEKCIWHWRVYENSFELVSNLSLSKMKYFLKTMDPPIDHYLAHIKQGHKITPVEDLD